MHQRAPWIVLGFAMAFASASNYLAQTAAPSVPLEVTSWKRGNDKITQTLLRLDIKAEEFDYDIFSLDSRHRYRLSVRKHLVTTAAGRSYQCALIGLREAQGSALPGGFNLGLELLDDDDPINTPPTTLCPVESPSIFEKNIVPFSSVRIFKVAGFVVRIVPDSFLYRDDYNLLTDLKVIVQFYNPSLTPNVRSPSSRVHSLSLRRLRPVQRT